VCGGESRHSSPLLATCPMSLLPGPKMAASQSTNLNHLLNFSLPPRQPHPPSTTCRRSRKTGTAHGPWNKERELVMSYLPSRPLRLDRLCQCSVSFCHESKWRLYCTFCGSRHVSPLSQSLETTHHRVLIVSFNGQTSCRSSYLDLRYWHLLPQHRSLRTIARPIAPSACLPLLLHG